MSRYASLKRQLGRDGFIDPVPTFIAAYVGATFCERLADWKKLHTKGQPQWQGNEKESANECEGGLMEAVVKPHILEPGRSFNAGQLREIFSIELNRPHGDMIDDDLVKAKLVVACRKLEVQDQINLFRWALENEPWMWVTIAVFQCIVAQIKGPAQKLARVATSRDDFEEIGRHKDDPIQMSYVAAMLRPINAVCELALEHAASSATVQ